MTPLVFLAVVVAGGLDLDLGLFRQRRFRAIVFGVLTTALPLALGTQVALWLGYALVPAIVVGSLLASHTRSQPSSQDPQDLQVAHSTPTLHQAAVESHKGLRLHLPLPCNPLCMATKQPSPAIAGVAPACRRP